MGEERGMPFQSAVCLAIFSACGDTCYYCVFTRSFDLRASHQETYVIFIIAFTTALFSLKTSAGVFVLMFGG
jgi:hypothetical protein